MPPLSTNAMSICLSPFMSEPVPVIVMNWFWKTVGTSCWADPSIVTKTLSMTTAVSPMVMLTW